VGFLTALLERDGTDLADRQALARDVIETVRSRYPDPFAIDRT
jgi:hypothetical protein